jgi:23S rRNA pseudouridine1911/1915/1917 synthase
MTSSSFVHSISPENSELTLAALLRRLLPDQSWSQVRALVAARRVKINAELCFDPARRVHEGETVELLVGSAPIPRESHAVVIRHVDQHLVVVEKPSGTCTVRHPSERDWPERRKALSPTLEDIVPRLIVARTQRPIKGKLPRLRVVQRLDKETSGLVVFARSVDAERDLGKQFKAHTVIRRYLAIVPGKLTAQRIATDLVRDRGDGRRGSTDVPGLGKQAVTHIEVVESLPGYTLLSCRLETGRTHQIRIHLSELGHPVCGEKVYTRLPDGRQRIDESGAPRLALHATELGFAHPVTKEAMHWSMPLPKDLAAFLEKLRNKRTNHADQVD